jgi:hypothetical protein
MYAIALCIISYSTSRYQSLDEFNNALR